MRSRFQQNGVLSVSENAAPLSMTMTAPLLNDLACCERRYILSKDVAIVYDYCKKKKQREGEALE
jgi:hypothetical protein